MPSLDPAKVKSKAVFKHPAGTFYALASDPFAGRLFAGGDEGVILVFDLAAPKKEPVARWAKHDNYVAALLSLQRGGRRVLISGSYDRGLVWWDAEAGKPVRAVEAHQAWVRDLALFPDGERFASVGDDMLLKVWETDSGRLLGTLDGHAKRTPQGHVTALYAVAVSPDGNFLASGDRTGEVCVWEADTGKLAQRLAVPIVYTYDPRQRKRSLGGIRSLAFSPDGTRLAVGGMNQVENVDGLAGQAHVEVWDWRTPARVYAAGLQGHKGLVNHVHFHPAGWLIGAGGGSDNGFLAFWQADPKKDQPPAVHRLKTDGHIHRFALDLARNELYSAGFHKLEVWGL